MTVLKSFILGIIQGLTEFIPVSSTAHLLIGQELLKIQSSDMVFAFQVIIQLGTVLSLILFFWKDIWQITVAFFLGIFHRKPFENQNARLGWLVIIATIPAGIAGLLLKDVIEARFQDPFNQASIRLLFTSVLLVLVEYFDNRKRHLDSATWVDALSVGLFQVLALFPGASRSGTTIAGGMVRGFDRPSAARFAFLMSAPILSAAGMYEMVKVIKLPGAMDLLPYLAIGFVTAAIVGWFAIKWLIGYLSKNSLYVFAAYCAVLGTIIFFLR